MTTELELDKKRRKDISKQLEIRGKCGRKIILQSHLSKRIVEIGVIEEYTHYSVHNNQQRPRAQELYSIFCNNLYRKRT